LSHGEDALPEACYLLASVFVPPSKHEGFCLPLVEAMAAKVPIVSYDSGRYLKTVAPPGSFCRIAMLNYWLIDPPPG